ncbi:Uncharacterized protein GBIM_19166, partial [Gryllus bimaculatus]
MSVVWLGAVLLPAGCARAAAAAAGCRQSASAARAAAAAARVPHSRVSFEEGVRTPVLQYAHPELGVQPAKVARSRLELEEEPTARTTSVAPLTPAAAPAAAPPRRPPLAPAPPRAPVRPPAEAAGRAAALRHEQLIRRQ